MGLKSGSRDAGLDEAEDNDEQSPDQKKAEGEISTSTTEEHSQGATTEGETPTANESETERTGQRPSMDSIPYKLRRNKVNEGREQVPYFLRKEIIAAEDDLQHSLEQMLGETVYKSDYREAAMVVAQRNPEFVAEVLREWGYDLEA